MSTAYEALRRITDMDPQGVRSDDLGRAARIAREALAAQPAAPGVPPGFWLAPDEPSDAMQKAGGHANSEWLNDNAPIGESRYVKPAEGVYKAMRAAHLADAAAPVLPPTPDLATCHCRWRGNEQVQQCTLHEAHVGAIHEWAERAKTAEAKLAAQPLTSSEVQALTCMQAGAPWAEPALTALAECITIYEQLRRDGKRPVDPADMTGVESAAHWAGREGAR